MKITKQTKVAEIVQKFPEIAKYLQIEWGFHCVSCILNGFDTLESAAEIHDLSEEDLELLLVIVNEMAVTEGNKKDQTELKTKVAKDQL